jgi:hypothetical protein
MPRANTTFPDNWTPAFDRIVQQHGLTTAAVFGVVWRYCQMKDGICKASIATLAARLNVNRLTIIHHLDILTAAGYLKDLSPNLRNRPHIYTYTGKFRLPVPAAVYPTDTSQPPAVSEIDTRYAEIDSPDISLSPLAVSETDLNQTLIRDSLIDFEEKQDQARTIWELICRQLSSSLSRSMYGTWIEPVRPVSWDGSTLTISVSSDYVCRYLTSRFLPTLNRILVGYQPGNSRLMILVDPLE